MIDTINGPAAIFDGQGWITAFAPSPSLPFVVVITQPPTLTELQAMVAWNGLGNSVELVFQARLGNPRVPVQVFVSEDGLFYNMPRNPHGTEWLLRYMPDFPHLLVGPMIVLSGKPAVWK